MSILIAVLATLALVGSVMWLKPSPAQRRQEAFRALARQLGLDVRLAMLPQTRRARVRQESPDPGVVYRRLQFDIQAPLARDYVLVRDGADAPWEPQTDEALPAVLQQALDGVLPELPRDSVAVELTAHGPGIYWRERGDAQAVRDLGEALERLLRALSAS